MRDSKDSHSRDKRHFANQLGPEIYKPVKGSWKSWANHLIPCVFIGPASGGQGIRTTSKNTGKKEFLGKAAHKAAQFDPLPNNQALAIEAIKSIGQSRLLVENLIDRTPKDDFATLGELGPILAELRTALATLERLQQNNA